MSDHVTVVPSALLDALDAAPYAPNEPLRCAVALARSMFAEPMT